MSWSLISTETICVSTLISASSQIFAPTVSLNCCICGDDFQSSSEKMSCRISLILVTLVPRPFSSGSALILRRIYCNLNTFFCFKQDGIGFCPSRLRRSSFPLHWLPLTVTTVLTLVKRWSSHLTDRLVADLFILLYLPGFTWWRREHIFHGIVGQCTMLFVFVHFLRLKAVWIFFPVVLECGHCKRSSLAEHTESKVLQTTRAI